MDGTKPKGSRRLRKLPVEYLWDGLVLKDDIFDHTGAVLLLPKGETVTQSRLQKLLRFDGDDKHIMVYEDTYIDIMMDEHVPLTVRQKITENYSGYTELKQSVDNFLNRPDYEAWLNSEQMEPLIQQITGKLTDIDPVMIFACINFPRPMDEALQRHSLNVAILNGMQAEWMEMPMDEVKTLVLAGLLHDIGKTRIPEEILNAPRKLTTEELAVMKMHPVYSYDLLAGKFGQNVQLAARHHHEKLDGSGYPDGISGDDISIYARITAISDIYDAMVSQRSYKEARLPFHVFDMFYREEFTGLDRQMVMFFLKNMRKNYVNKQVVMSDGRRGKIRYIPPNDAEHPIIQQQDVIRQTDEQWYCREVVSIS